MQFSKPLAAIAAGLCAIALAACSSGDDAIPDDVTDPPPTTTQPSSTTTAPAPATMPPTSVTVTTSAPTDPPTTPVPATTVEDVKAQIQADLDAGKARLLELQMNPSVDGLEENLAAIAVPGSEYFQRQVTYITELARLGDVLTLGDPPINSLTIETVELEGEPPYTGAMIKVCDASNLGRITPAANSPVGEDIIVSDPELIAFRYSIHVVRSETGWLRDTAAPRNVDAGFPGSATCG